MTSPAHAMVQITVNKICVHATGIAKWPQRMAATDGNDRWQRQMATTDGNDK